MVSSCSPHSLKPLPVQRPKGSYRQFVCAVCVCLCFRAGFGADLGHCMQQFSILSNARKANTSVSFSPVHILSFTITLFIGAQDLQRWAAPQPKVSSIDTYRHTQRFGCVCFYFCLYPVPADGGDSWSLTVCEQGRVRMRTARVSRLRAQCFQPDVHRGTLSSPG